MLERRFGDADGVRCSRFKWLKLEDARMLLRREVIARVGDARLVDARRCVVAVVVEVVVDDVEFFRSGIFDGEIFELLMTRNKPR